jgi:hypothetical protein
VYFALPFMADRLGWDTEQRYWAAWLNANTQNPVTTLLLMEHGDRPSRWQDVANWQQKNWATLQWDSDRKYQKGPFPAACEGYVRKMEQAGGQEAYWAGVRTWAGAWSRMTDLPYMGRLSAWSGLEYFRLLTDAPIPPADTLLLRDVTGSRSHRNGLALLAGYDTMLQDNQLNPDAPLEARHWNDQFTAHLEDFASHALALARQRNPGHPDVGYLTLESTLCTWKSWSKKNRRYPGVYADMMHDRIRWAEARHGDRFGVLWDARAATLPSWLRLEVTPGDPGVKPVKQNHYRDTGHTVTMGYVWPELWSEFDDMVAEGKFGKCR